MRKTTTVLLLVAVGLSCSKDTTGPNPVPPTITVIPDSATVDVFDTLHLRAVIVDAKGDTLTDAIGWSTAAPNVVFVSSTGRVQGENRGTVTISATADGATGTARIKVKINVIQVQLQPSRDTLQVGDTVRIKGTLVTADGLAPDDSVIAWASSDTAKAVLSATGLVTARSQGAVTLSAQVDSAVGHATIIVPEPVTKVILSAHLDTLRQDSTFSLSGVTLGTANDTLTSRPIMWTSSDTSVAKLSTDPFDATVGAYHTGRAVIRGQVGTVFDSCVIIVVRPSVATITVTPDTGRRILPGAFAVHATIKDSIGLVLTQRVITWTLSDTSLADVGPNTGTDVVVTGKNPGTLRVRATSEGKVDSATFQFLHPSVAFESIVPDTGSFIIPTQSYFSLSAVVRDSAGDTLTDRVTTWAIADTTIAVLSPLTGPATNVIGKKGGLAVVVATTEGHVDTARIRVIRPSVSKIVLTPDTATIVAPAGVTISSTVEDSLGQQLPGRPTHWASLDTAIASVSDTNGDHIDVDGKASGTARIVASSEGVSDTAFVHVIRPSVAQIVFVPPVDTSHLLLGAARAVTVEPLDSNGTPLSRPVIFASSDSAVVRPMLLGQGGALTSEAVTGEEVGSAVITASIEGKSVTWHASVYSLAFSAVAAAGDEACALTAADSLYCWRSSTYPHPIVNAAGLVSIAADGGSACGLDGSGTASCWGNNTNSQLGTGGGNSYDTAHVVLGGHQFSQIDPGLLHTCAVATDHTAWCWGTNNDYQIGADDSVDFIVSIPTAVTGGVSFSVVSAGDGHTCGLALGGSAYCWGSNGAGQLGTGVSSPTLVPHPVAVTGALTFATITAGDGHTCGLTSAGAAYCWGDNTYGQLGDGTSTPRNAPTPVAGGLTFTAIAAGVSFTCGVTTGGDMYCWGLGQYYSLGNGTQTSESAPTLVSGGLHFQTVTAGGGSRVACGMASGVAYCWGNGAVGNPNGVAATPTKVPGQP